MLKTTRILRRRLSFMVLVMSLHILAGCKICAADDCINGDCKNGTCVCDEGWAGSECERREKKRFTGWYDVDVDARCGGKYAVQIIASDDNNYDLQIIGMNGETQAAPYGAYSPDTQFGFFVRDQPFYPPGYTISMDATKNGNNTVSVNFSTKDMFGDYDDICIVNLVPR